MNLLYAETRFVVDYFKLVEFFCVSDISIVLNIFYGNSIMTQIETKVKNNLKNTWIQQLFMIVIKLR